MERFFTWVDDEHKVLHAYQVKTLTGDCLHINVTWPLLNIMIGHFQNPDPVFPERIYKEITQKEFFDYHTKTLLALQAFSLAKIVNEPLPDDEEKLLNWGELKAFSNNLLPEQLQQDVRLFFDDVSVGVKYASSLGEEHYSFPDHDYSTSKEDFDKDCITDIEPPIESFEDALNRVDYCIIPASNVYLYGD